MNLDAIWSLARRFVPRTAADRRLYESSPSSWWPAHEIGHFLVATRAECRVPKFGIDGYAAHGSTRYRHVIAKEIAATTISQRILRRSGHADLADEEIQYTDETTIECSFESWCKRGVRALFVRNRITRLPTTSTGMERLLSRKARAVGLVPS
jgi:hypothetical protein